MRRARRETPLANSAWRSHGHRDGSGRRCREQGRGCGFRGTERQWGAERFRGDGGEGRTTVCRASATAVCTRDGGGTSTGRAPGKGHGVPRGEPPRLADSSQPARGLQTARACSPGGGSPTQGPPRRTRGAPPPKLELPAPPVGRKKRNLKGRGFNVLTSCASPIKMPSIFSHACYFLC